MSLCTMPGCNNQSREPNHTMCGSCGVWKSSYPGFTRPEVDNIKNKKRCDCCHEFVPRTVVKWNVDGLCDHPISTSKSIIGCIYCDVHNLCSTCNARINKVKNHGLSRLPKKDLVAREQILDYLLLDDPYPQEQLDAD